MNNKQGCCTFPDTCSKCMPAVEELCNVLDEIDKPDDFRIDPAKTTLTLSDKERMKLEGFLEGHGDCTDSELIFEVSHGSGIGVSVEVTCRKCGGKQDITDYGIW